MLGTAQQKNLLKVKLVMLEVHLYLVMTREDISF
jgi:hypothetical protein